MAPLGFLKAIFVYWKIQGMEDCKGELDARGV